MGLSAECVHECIFTQFSCIHVTNVSIGSILDVKLSIGNVYKKGNFRPLTGLFSRFTGDVPETMEMLNMNFQNDLVIFMNFI